jgi:hypothetical protein
MKLALSTAERVCIAAIMNKGGWGGSPAVLLAQVTLYETLQLAEFAALTPASLTRAAANHLDRTVYELTDDAAQVLVSVLATGGQTIQLAMMTVGVLRRMDPVAGASLALHQEPAPPPPTNHRAKRKAAP